MKWKNTLLVLCCTALWVSCNNEDDNILPGIEVPPRDLAEVAVEDDAEIRAFLQTHFYNYEEFQTPPADFDYRIRIDTIAGENADKTPLIDQVSSAVVTVTPEELNLDQESGEVPHTYYYLEARAGVGVSPTTGDSVLTRYTGRYLDGTAFDGRPDYNWQSLPFFLKGYREALTNFSSASEDSFVINPDGTAGFANNGIGMLIIPSGLGYFNNTSQGIREFSPLIFYVDLGAVIVDTDSDDDGIPNYLEDLNGNGEYFDDNTDLEWENNNFQLPLSDFRDPDDDADGIPTREEIIITEEGIVFPDSDGDGIPDYRDRDS